MSRRRRTVEDWRNTVYQSSTIGDPVRVLLLYMADYMKADRSVSIPRQQIANALGKSPRRITERITAAHEAGFLDTKEPGYRGHTAVYEGLFGIQERETPHRPLSVTNDLESGTSTSPLSSAETRPLSTEERWTPGGPTNRRADLTETHDGPNDGYEEKADATLTFLLSADSWATDCPHGMPGGAIPDPWDETNPRDPACPECRAPRSKSERRNSA